ncbi:MAG: methyltransferase domain-containing protein [Chloroflexi bacterium]|nr:methyltransferase domain-containing protein [Chloroflexota bacterium]
MTNEAEFPAHFFRRQDESADDLFYWQPRFVTHIDDATIDALTALYREVIPPGAEVLDLMSSWISHLPDEIAYGRVAGLGMNEEELAQNPRLSDYNVHDLNRDPELPYADASFDVVLNAVSIQYLTRPVPVFASIRRVLRPGGLALVACSHRMFPTKAVAVWQSLPPADRIRLVGSYFALAGGFDEPAFIDRSPAGADPLWVISALRSTLPGTNGAGDPGESPVS